MFFTRVERFRGSAVVQANATSDPTGYQLFALGIADRGQREADNSRLRSSSHSLTHLPSAATKFLPAIHFAFGRRGRAPACTD